MHSLSPPPREPFEHRADCSAAPAAGRPGLLASAVPIAVLLSGLNALVQIVRVAVELSRGHSG
jgi:hypothetical protein